MEDITWSREREGVLVLICCRDGALICYSKWCLYKHPGQSCESNQKSMDPDLTSSAGFQGQLLQDIEIKTNDRSLQLMLCFPDSSLNEIHMVTILVNHWHILPSITIDLLWDFWNVLKIRLDCTIGKEDYRTLSNCFWAWRSCSQFRAQSYHQGPCCRGLWSNRRETKLGRRAWSQSESVALEPRQVGEEKGCPFCHFCADLISFVIFGNLSWAQAQIQIGNLSLGSAQIYDSKSELGPDQTVLF
jgi:hypothetical protein